MTRGILIAGNESSLCHALSAEAAKRVEHFAIAMIPNRLSEAPRYAKADSPAEKAPLPLQWNPSSPISARTLVLAAENRLGQINEAVLVCSPPSIRRPAADLSLTDIEILVNEHIKGWFFLARELAAAFRARQAGTLALAFSEIAAGSVKDDAADILGPCAQASFQSFTRSLCASAYAEPYLTLGFSNSDASAEAGFASFVFKSLDESNIRNNGKLHKYGKLNLFK
jgi:NAD(P)-dependent dehydrogenase (short-subunit alcohol dehydrogenase family)